MIWKLLAGFNWRKVYGSVSYILSFCVLLQSSGNGLCAAICVEIACDTSEVNSISAHSFSFILTAPDIPELLFFARYLNFI